MADFKAGDVVRLKKCDFDLPYGFSYDQTYLVTEIEGNMIALKHKGGHAADFFELVDFETADVDGHPIAPQYHDYYLQGEIDSALPGGSMYDYRQLCKGALLFDIADRKEFLDNCIEAMDLDTGIDLVVQHFVGLYYAEKLVRQ